MAAGEAIIGGFSCVIEIAWCVDLSIMRAEKQGHHAKSMTLKFPNVLYIRT